MKKNKGITLIALVISIIVMLILATITIIVAIKGDLFSIAKRTTELSEIEIEKERIMPVLINMVIKNPQALHSDVETLKSNLQKELEVEVLKVIDLSDKKIYFLYKRNNSKYLCFVEKDSAVITLLIKNTVDVIEGEIPDGEKIQKEFEKAKNIDYKIKTNNSNGYNNVLYTSHENVINAYSGAQQWTVNEIDLKTEAYCANNIMIYDEESNPYVPVMVRFWRENEDTSFVNKKERGLRYFEVTNPTDMVFTTSDENNYWNFVETKEYNYDTKSDRKCSSNKTIEKMFKDVEYNSYFASGRLTYNKVPTEMLTVLGEFKATSCDNESEDKRTYKDFSVGSNYVIDVREYYATIKEGKKLLQDIGDKIPTSISTQTYELSFAIISAIEDEYNYNTEKNTYENSEIYIYQLKNKTENIKEKIDALKKAQEEYNSKITPEVRAIIEAARTAQYTIPTLNITGGNNIVYTSHENIIDAYSGAQEWEVGGIKLRTEAYCANNIMIYDGNNNPYVPVMVRFWREDKNTVINKKQRGLRYFEVTNPTDMVFTTPDENNYWNFVKAREYNYDIISNKKCSSNTTIEKTFKDVEHDSCYASGRLTYDKVPTEVLTVLGEFKATSCDNENEDKRTYKVFTIGSNYLIDVREYYNAIQEAQRILLVEENLFENPEAAYELAQKVNEYVKNEYTFSDAQKFSEEIIENTKNIKELNKKWNR